MTSNGIGKYNLSVLYRGKTSEVIGIVAIVLVCTAVLLLWLANAEKVSLATIISHISIGLYPFRNENLFVVNKIRDRNIFIYAYLIIIVSSIIALFLKDTLQKPGIQKKKEKGALKALPHPAFIAGLTVFFLVSALQLAYQVNYFSNEIKTYSGKTVSEKNLHIFGLPYAFAAFCQKHLPGYHRGEYVSDYSADEALGLGLRYRVAYYAYPINVRIPTEEPVDSYVVFQKKDPTDAIPKDFKRRYHFDRFSVLAVKEKPK